LQDMAEVASWEVAVRRHLLPGGSLAKGAAMPGAPVALAFYPDSSAATQAAEEQARVTGHTHPEALLGARLQVRAVLRALECASHGVPFHAEEFLRENIGAGPEIFSTALQWIGNHLGAASKDAVANLGGCRFFPRP
jgi:ADP-ribosylglycohydrolase